MFLRFLSRCTVGVISAVVLPAVAASPAASRELKVCAEPNNMPFSNDRAEGFENRFRSSLPQNWVRRSNSSGNRNGVGLCAKA